MRWLLGSLAGPTATDEQFKELFQLGDFPDLPAYPEIKRRIAEQGPGTVVRFSAITAREQDYRRAKIYGRAIQEAKYYRGIVRMPKWPPDLWEQFIGEKIGYVHACLPFLRAHSSWGVFPEGAHEIRSWREQSWSSGLYEIFKEARKDRERKLENLRKSRELSSKQDNEIQEQPTTWIGKGW